MGEDKVILLDYETISREIYSRKGSKRLRHSNWNKKEDLIIFYFIWYQQTGVHNGTYCIDYMFMLGEAMKKTYG